MKRKQFTLIEMLVVIAIIAVLATMIGSAVFGVKEKGNRTTCLNNLKQLYTALNSYRDAQGGFPFIDSTTVTTGGGENHAKLLFLIRKTEAGDNPNLYICPSSTTAVPGSDKARSELSQSSDFKSENNSYAYFMGKIETGQKGTMMRTTSGILSDGFRGQDPSKTDNEGWNHTGAGNWVNVDSSGKQAEDENWPDQVKGQPVGKGDWAAFKLQ